VDIVPTILSLLGAAPPAAMQGMSLEPWMRPGPVPPARERDVYAVAYPGAVGHMPRFVRRYFAKKVPDLPIQMALRTGDWKYVYPSGGGSPRLYDLRRDPHETRDLLGQRQEFRSCRVRLLEWFDRTRKEEGNTALTAEDIRKLESLGYVGRPRPRPTRRAAPTTRPGAPPRRGRRGEAAPPRARRGYFASFSTSRTICASSGN